MEEESRVRIDNMKKKAITTAHSYDEFKNMVACANLKPLQSKEIDFQHVNRCTNKAFKVTQDYTQSVDNLRDEGKGCKSLLRVPKNNNEFNKVWRKLSIIER